MIMFYFICWNKDISIQITKNYLHNLGSLEERGSIQLLGIDEFEEVVGVSDDNARHGVDPCWGHEEVDAEQDPGQELGLEPGAEPEIHDHVLVQLAPDVQNGEHHRVHEEHEVGEETDETAGEPVEEQHVEVVARTLLILVLLQSARILVQEVAVQHEVEPCRGVDRVVKNRRHQTPYLK